MQDRRSDFDPGQGSTTEQTESCSRYVAGLRGRSTPPRDESARRTATAIGDFGLMHGVERLLGDPERFESLRRSLDGGAPPRLLDAKIKLTSRCNLRCRMCHYWETRREEALATDEWRRVLGELAGAGATKVHFSGGEVFLRKDFLPLVEHAAGLGLRVNLTTNGTLVDRDDCRRLVQAGVNAISISLDGPKSKIHDAVRGVPGAFRRTVRTIRRLGRESQRVKKPPTLRINFVVMRNNYRRLPEMVDLAASLGASDLHAMPVDEKGPRKNRLSRTQIEEYERDVAPLVEDARRRAGFRILPDDVHPFGTSDEEIAASRDGFYARGRFERESCLAPFLHTFLAWNGDVFLCCMTNGRIEPLGNVRRQSVGEVFEGDRYRAVRSDFLAGRHFGDCARCDLFLPENAKVHEALRLAERRTG